MAKPLFALPYLIAADMNYSVAAQQAGISNARLRNRALNELGLLERTYDANFTPWRAAHLRMRLEDIQTLVNQYHEDCHSR